MKGALVGFGKIAESTHLPALQQAGLEVVAICDALAARREAAQSTGAHVYDTLDALLAGESLDFVDVCTPPHLHFSATRAALTAGLHVLCEKPLVLTLEHADELVRLAQSRGRVVTCMHNWTQAPILVRARELAKELGGAQRMDFVTLRTQPAQVAGDSGNWRIDPDKAGGGIVFDHGWHGMSILLRTLGRKPLAVRGLVEKRKYKELSVEDSCEIQVRFDGRLEGRFVATWAADERKNTARIECARGVIEIENDTLRWDGKSERFEESLAGGGYRPAWTAGIAREFRREIEDPALRGRSLEEALGCLRLLRGTYASAAQGGAPIAIVPVEAAAVPGASST